MNDERLSDGRPMTAAAATTPTDAYDPFEDYESLRRRRPGSNGSNGTHHPISRVRYRGSGPTENGREDSPGPPRSRSWEADTWEYDI